MSHSLRQAVGGVQLAQQELAAGVSYAIQLQEASMAGSALQMETQPEVERESDMGRPSFGEQGPHFIFQSSFYTLSYACLTWRQQRGPRASPGTGRGDGAHREPLVKVGSAPGARSPRAWRPDFPGAAREAP